jgi:molybdenum cofactor guanylyltransferase
MECCVRPHGLKRYHTAVGRDAALRRPVGAARRPYHPPLNISAVLLAGGESRRMGTDKATLIFRGKLLWQIQIDLLRKLKPAEILISARVDPAWRPADLPFVPDDSPSRGPLSGLTSSLARVRSSHLLALAIDMPFMSETYLRSLYDRIEPGHGILPMIDDRAEPLAAIYPTDIYQDFVTALSGNDSSLQTLTKRLVKAGKLRAILVTRESERFFRNLNEPADLV